MHNILKLPASQILVPFAPVVTLETGTTPTSPVTLILCPIGAIASPTRWLLSVL